MPSLVVPVIIALLPQPPSEDAEQQSIVTIASWQDLDDELSKLELKKLSHKEMSKSRRYRFLAEHGGLSTYLEMTLQGRHWLVPLAGFNLVCARYPDHAMQAAILTGLCGHLTLLVNFDPLWEELSKPRDQAQFNRQIPALLAAVNADTRNLSLVVCALPQQQLNRWFNDPQRITLPAHIEAEILSEAMLANSQDPSPVTPFMRETFETYGLIPGPARIVFLSAASENHERFMTNLVAALEAADLDDSSLHYIVRRRRDYIRNYVDIDSLSVTEGRRETIRKWLDYVPSATPQASQPFSIEDNVGSDQESQTGERAQ